MDYSQKQYTVTISVFSICMLLLTALIWIQNNQLNSVQIEIGKAGFCNHMINESHTILGYYQSDVGYTVFTKGRNKEEINKTECHEYCHFVIDKDEESKNHFCGDY
jgi:hypothetical protein